MDLFPEGGEPCRKKGDPGRLKERDFLAKKKHRRAVRTGPLSEGGQREKVPPGSAKKERILFSGNLRKKKILAEKTKGGKALF